MRPARVPAGLVGARVRVRRGASALEQEVGAAVETALARAGAAVLTRGGEPADLEMSLGLDLRSVGVAVEGIATLTLERDGVLVDRVATPLDIYRRDRFAAAAADRLTEALADSPRVASFASAGMGPVAAAQPAAPAPGPPSPDVAVPPPAATQPVVVAASSALGKSGLFGLGVSLELQLGLFDLQAPGAAPVGAVVGVATQVDVGPRSALRFGLLLSAAGSGDDGAGQALLSAAYLYRFRHDAAQTVVPYVGAGVALEGVAAGRHLLGRPVTGMRTADSCTRRGTTADCAFTVSPMPLVGIEWHQGPLFSIDFGATYAFAYLTSSEGQTTWLHSFALFAAPRWSF
jgi:hypothetical protein